MRVIVPYDGRDPKTRLSTLLDRSERNEFSRSMLRDVVSVIQSTGRDPLVLSSTPLEIEDCSVCVDDRSLSRAVNERLQASSTATAVVMADLPLITDTALERLLTREADVVLARGIGGGTNALVSRTADFAVDYHGNSYLDHRSTAREIGAALAEIDSYRLAMDVDVPDDLVEVLLHGEGHATQWLRDQGFRLASGPGRTTVRRTDVTQEPFQ
ncbi:2-phospho-L-lactate guanylyltransferase [Natrinema sp. 1APR25-10V2]|uniref:2-phospho-L-lactate guanylyltransferase n=1 Tax=Natrinema sp. 1APR25-10V2 TaxID=2951081 RepID=UPI002875FA44|nr:2-phospho-L-lactate guanylyltransferase [Natrinema sp. 1APR25-10V2]MDS0477280.1 2-phospho-L-lactate guanylyltransferase [Natrinema sp. 1APR25-10V2]